MTETKEKIVRQALMFFSQNDYERASLKDIAGALGVTKGAIYHYFGSKDELFLEAVLTAIGSLGEMFVSMIGESRDLPFKEQMRMWFNFGAMVDDSEEVLGVDMTNHYTNTMYLMFTSIKKFPVVRERVVAIYDAFIDDLTGIFEAARERGDIDGGLDCRALAFELTAFAEGAMLLAGIMDHVDLVDYGGRIFNNFWLRIGPKEEENG